MSSTTGAPLQFTADTDPDRRYLLDPTSEPWHTYEREWGSGFVITDRGSARWHQPSELTLDEDRSTATFTLGDHLALTITRTIEDGALTESYAVSNASDAPISITSMGISCPFQDTYSSARESLQRSVHAHVWTGGTDSWIVAQPMSGIGPVLAVDVVDGRLSSYSIESRNANSSSNVRGHIVVHPTDAARNERAFGGQQPIVLPATATYTLTWRVRFVADMAAFESDRTGSFGTLPLHTAVGDELVLPHGGAIATADRPEAVTTATDSQGRTVVTSAIHQVCEIDVSGARTAVLFREPLSSLVRKRVRFILTHQLARERPAPDSAAMVPYDTSTGLTWAASGWSDWNDGAERLAMPTLLQQAALLGWTPLADVKAPLHAWAEFARARLVSDDGTVRWGSASLEPCPRLYNFPWMAHFFADQYRLFGDSADLELATRIIRRGIALGADEHLSIGHAEACATLIEIHRSLGQDETVSELEQHIVRSAEHFASLGPDLPAHEVNYEQSIVAPLISLLGIASGIIGDDRFLPHLTTTLEWLRAFAGPQPHIRLRHVPLRHWDGYWFGVNRLWGDTMPHHWSVLSAVAMLMLPPELRTERLWQEAEQICIANLTLFRDDGAATCAFVMPGTVDGRPGYTADPLANDQDWALTLVLRYASEFFTGER
ncbi:hypothetical protein [Promicromonospora sp. AC04]|uniref:hypothetical protein n=1 Tax=Promicromonospora sp. AC04 TaxID=2135723 RepID=UPI0011B20F97|nr:hypothetical protein [Promicromonospora sp. AC04]